MHICIVYLRLNTQNLLQKPHSDFSHKYLPSISTEKQLEEFGSLILTTLYLPSEWEGPVVTQVADVCCL